MGSHGTRSPPQDITRIIGSILKVPDAALNRNVDIEGYQTRAGAPRAREA
jgi:hypothetical protein